MFGGQEGLRRLMEQETSKPANLGVTLARFGAYFKPYWLLLVLTLVLVVGATWAQVTIPELIGQVVDCYLVPASGGASNGSAAALAPGDEAGIVWQLLVGAGQPAGGLYPAGDFHPVHNRGLPPTLRECSRHGQR